MTEQFEGANKPFATDTADLSATIHAAAASKQKESRITPVSFNGEGTKVEVIKVYTNPIQREVYPLDDYGAPEPRFRKG